MVINIALSLALFFVFRAWGWMPHIGIAIATSIAGWTNAILLWLTLSRSDSFAWDGRLTRNLPLIALAAVLMGVALWFAGPHMTPYTTVGNPLVLRVAVLGALVLGGMVIFFGLTALSGVLTLARLRRAIAREG
jgi:putative peptidoglycan lipid II flippase